MPAFRSAVSAGSDLVELDYVHSADGVPVVIHDDTLDRTTDAKQVFGGEKIPVESKSMAELLKLDAGAWFGPKFSGTRLPSLEQSLDEIQDGSVTLIERKEGNAQTCVALLKRKELLHDVVVQAFDWKFLSECHAPGSGSGPGRLGGGELNDRRIEKIRDGREGRRLARKLAECWRIAKLHEAGLSAWAWTIDNPERKTLLDAGLDGVITNAPAKMKALLPVNN